MDGDREWRRILVFARGRDDHESWAQGLTPALLRDNWKSVIGLAENGGSALAVEESVAHLVKEAASNQNKDDFCQAERQVKCWNLQAIATSIQ